MASDQLPALREDLRLFKGPIDRHGAPTWTIYDPKRHRYCRIGEAGFHMLRFWQVGEVKGLLDVVKEKAGISLTVEDLNWMVQFLRSHQLTARSDPEDVGQLSQIDKLSQQAWYKSIVHHYLFFRIPILRPDAFLDATVHMVRPLYRKVIVFLLAVVGLFSLFLVARQWESFHSSFLHFFTWEGAVWYGSAILFAKILHEFGHAYSAKLAGCRVPTMGVAFMVMWPVLYTDTSDVWRLRDKKKKLEIAFAGIFVELVLAIFATLIWSFLPEGPLKSVAFLLASVTWLMTLAINLNPFMRFDGYYLLSDLLEIENLQDRSFSLAKWRLREILFKLKAPAPEALPERLRSGLIIYAFLTWIYRFFLFLGIAFLVYTFFFKLLGLVLFALEILWFILFPVMKEIKFWWGARSQMEWSSRSVVIVSGLGLGVSLLLIPWQTTVQVPGVFQAAKSTHLYISRPAQLETLTVKQGDQVQKGAFLMQFRADDLEIEIERARERIALNKTLLDRQAASIDDRAVRQVLEQELVRAKSKLTHLLNQRDTLALHSPINGLVTEVDQAMRPGLWVNEEQPIAQIVDFESAQLRGFVDEAQLGSFAEGSPATFYADQLEFPLVKATVLKVAQINTTILPEASLASLHGGRIPVQRNEHQQLVPITGLYEVVFHLDSKAPAQPLQGVIHVQGQRESYLTQFVKNIWSVLIRESGF